MPARDVSPADLKAIVFNDPRFKCKKKQALRSQMISVILICKVYSVAHQHCCAIS
jgi:hypothetical protein